MGQAALSGNRLAQHRWTRIVREAEREQRKAQTLIYNALERTHYRRNPQASYADDIIFDTTNGDTLIRDLRASDASDEAT
jgi:Tfp pilus assembly protein PilV